MLLVKCQHFVCVSFIELHIIIILLDKNNSETIITKERIQVQDICGESGMYDKQICIIFT